MKARKLLIVLAVVGSLILAGCALTGPTQDVPTASPTNSLNKDPQNATYLLDGQAITLVNGVAEVEAAPGSASKQVVRYFGNAVDIDLNGDGAMDQAFLLVQDSGGSGNFYFAVAALNMPDGYVGTNAIFIGDRIAPQNTVVDPNNPMQFIVNYADRKADEPMSAQPSQGVSKSFKLEGDVLVEVVSP